MSSNVYVQALDSDTVHLGENIDHIQTLRMLKQLSFSSIRLQGLGVGVGTVVKTGMFLAQPAKNGSGTVSNTT
jgi:hypothetical protein